MFKRNNQFVISQSDRPVGLYRLVREQSHAVLIPTVQLEYVVADLHRLIRENDVAHLQLTSFGALLESIKAVPVALDIIAYKLFLYVDTDMSFHQFLAHYARVPDRCPACQRAIDRFVIDERLEHIIACQRRSIRSVVVAVAKGLERPRSST